VLEDVETLHDCQRYHCLPSDLLEQDKHEMDRLRAIARAEERYLAMDRRSKAERAKRQAGRRR